MNEQQQISPRQLAKIYRQALEQGLPLDKLEEKVARRFDKLATSQKIEKKAEKEKIKKMKHRLPPLVRYGAMALPVVFLVVGLYLLGSATWPIVRYYTDTLPDLAQAKLIAPIPQEEILDVTPSINHTQVAGAESPSTGPIILDTELDFTDLSNWFSDDRSLALEDRSDEVVYTIDIPSVDIENAEVKVGGTNLDESLIAYPGTALPGDTGAPVIFGHSVLRQFYNPGENNPRRYNSIFSYIMTLQPGDEIFVTENNTTYKYVVREKTEVKPEDTYILAQQHNSRLLKLVTCVPEGTYLRRGVVTAELVSS